MLVVMRNAFSTNGRMPSTTNPDCQARGAGVQAVLEDERPGIKRQHASAAVASAIAIAAAPPISISLLRVADFIQQEAGGEHTRPR